MVFSRVRRGEKKKAVSKTPTGRIGKEFGETEKIAVKISPRDRARTSHRPARENRVEKARGAGVRRLRSNRHRAGGRPRETPGRPAEVSPGPRERGRGPAARGTPRRASPRRSARARPVRPSRSRHPRPSARVWIEPTRQADARRDFDGASPTSRPARPPALARDSYARLPARAPHARALLIAPWLTASLPALGSARGASPSPPPSQPRLPARRPAA